MQRRRRAPPSAVFFTTGSKALAARKPFLRMTLPITGALVSVRTLKLTPDKTSGTNLQTFPVTPGKPFTFDALYNGYRQR